MSNKRKWTRAQSAEALQQGWDVFDVDGALQIQRDDESAVFQDDAQAISWVALCANAGKPLHVAALTAAGHTVDTALAAVRVMRGAVHGEAKS